MRPHLLAAGVAVAALIPSFALAQSNCEQRRSQQTAGTIAGAGIGAVLGSIVAGRGDRTTGAVIGGLGGGILGNQLSKPGVGCAYAYGYYDNSGAWHASNVSKQNARGYYDREGAWVEGAPDGHYNNDGRWVRTVETPAAAGYYDARGRWVPVSATGYYADNGRWVTGAAPGHYDRSGRWVQRPSSGRYDAQGRWIAGQPSRASGNGRGEVHLGYYDQGRWHAGETTGYYDAQGRWIRVEGWQSNSQRGAQMDIDARQSWLSQRIRNGLDDGSLTRREGDTALRTMASIEREEASLRTRRGALRPRDEQMIQARLDTLTESVRIARRGPVRQY